MTVHCTKYNKRMHNDNIIATSRLEKNFWLPIVGSDPPNPLFGMPLAGAAIAHTPVLVISSQRGRD